MPKPRVAIFDFACCEGCQLQIVNMEEELLDLLTVIDPMEWREAMSDQSEDYDIAIVEGSITREQDAERLRVIRERADISRSWSRLRSQPANWRSLPPREARWAGS